MRRQHGSRRAAGQGYGLGVIYLGNNREIASDRSWKSDTPRRRCDLPVSVLQRNIRNRKRVIGYATLDIEGREAGGGYPAGLRGVLGQTGDGADYSERRLERL